ncbi:nucleotidyltransferase domain-containing protein [Cytophagaceae bacterium ABcell3]|nr:nucleotidyltransferase domain-containing protein [Cytophagaceae bacterium ABcell3]
MNIQDIKNQNLILLECISGSRAFGLATPESDTDVRGVFYLPREKYFGLEYIPQISNETNDIVYYELGRFIELLLKNNPNIIELLNTPDDCILQRNPIMDHIRTEMFLSKLCEQTFGNYALSQIRKARGLNKKIVNPMEKERKTVLDFCYVNDRAASLPLKEFLAAKNMEQAFCGLTSLPHMRDMYALFYDESGKYKGIVQKNTANEISLSSVPKDAKPVALLYFNKDGYSQHCRSYKEYWDWVNKRNETRYQGNLAHGKNYDAKNMMHVFRLLTMAEEIGEKGKVIVRRPDRDFLLSIKKGDFSYEELVEKAEEKRMHLQDIYEKSTLPDTPDAGLVNNLLVEMREKLYCSKT